MIEKELMSLLESSWIPKHDLQMQFRQEYMPMGQLAPEYQEVEKAFRADNVVQYGISDILSIAARQDREKNRIEQASRVLMSMRDDPAAAKVLGMINKLKAKKLSESKDGGLALMDAKKMIDAAVKAKNQKNKGRRQILPGELQKLKDELAPKLVGKRTADAKKAIQDKLK